MNDIVRPITADKMVGYDEYNQLWLYRQEGESRIGTIISDVREKICQICNHGWEPTAPSMQDQHYWRDRRQHVHESCFIRHCGLVEFDMWHGFLCGVFRFEGLDEIPNGYWPKADPWSKQPWYMVKLLDSPHPLKLGRRKRVDHMEILPATDSTIDAALATELLGKEDVTKEISATRVLIHAWSEAKAKEYLAAFRKILGITKP